MGSCHERGGRCGDRVVQRGAPGSVRAFLNWFFPSTFLSSASLSLSHTHTHTTNRVYVFPHHSSLTSLQLGSLQPLREELLPRAALALRRRASAARDRLASAVAASAAAAALLEGAAASLESGTASALPLPVFASLGLPAIAGCFRRAAEPHGRELERVRSSVVAAADAAVDEWRSKGTTRKKGKRESSSSSAATAASAAKIEQRLRSRLTVVIAAWKLQALLGPGVAASGGKAAVGSAGAGVAAELACVGAEMEGF